MNLFSPDDTTNIRTVKYLTEGDSASMSEFITGVDFHGHSLYPAAHVTKVETAYGETDWLYNLGQAVISVRGTEQFHYRFSSFRTVVG